MIAVIKCLMLIDVLHLSCKGGVFGDNSGMIFFYFSIITYVVGTH